MTKKKIIFSDNTLWGLLNFRGEIIEHYIKKGDQIILIAPQDEHTELLAEVPKNVTFMPVKMERNKTNPFSDLKYFINVFKIYKKEKPDYIFHYTIKPNIYGSIAAKLNGIKSSAMMAGLGYSFRNNNFVSKVGRFLYKIGLLCTDNLFLLNADNVDEILKRKICNKNKINFLKGGEGVNLAKFDYTDNKSQITTFLYIGRILYDKGYQEFVDCAKAIKKTRQDVNFEILGTIDPNYPNSVQLSTVMEDQRKGYINYIGFTKDIKQVYKRKGIVVTLPSYYGEGLNRSLMEACATGKPIITTDNPGCKETVRNGINGYIVKPRSSKQLTEVVSRYLQLSNDEKEEMSKESRKLAEELFDINFVIKKYDELI